LPLWEAAFFPAHIYMTNSSMQKVSLQFFLAHTCEQ